MTKQCFRGEYYKALYTCCILFNVKSLKIIFLIIFVIVLIAETKVILVVIVFLS